MPTTLWPELPAASPALRGMRQVLLDAGSDLTEQTNGVLRFQVQPYQIGGTGFRYLCFAVPVSSSNVAVELCSVETGLIQYPANLYTADGTQIQGIKNELELRTHLAAVFQSERTKEILVNLIANFG